MHTLFLLFSYDGIWKGQNRRTGEVGYVSSEYVNINTYTISGIFFVLRNIIFFDNII